ncbi:MAG TPA: hypothetical protein VEL47_02305, partial [Myxococcota bacterium]|nr:hypothetical protein [Myxococcota bacterium]
GAIYFLLLLLPSTMLHAAFTEVQPDPVLVAKYKEMFNGRKYLNLEYQNLKTSDAIAIGAVLESNNTLTSFRVLFADFGNLGWAAVAKGIAHNQVLQNLDLTNIAMNEGSIETFRRAMAINKTLITLDFCNNQIGALEMKILAPALNSTSGLTELYIRSNEIGDGGMEALADSLKFNPPLKLLNLGANRIGPEGGKCLASALKENRNLEKLYLSENRIGDEGAKAVADALRLNSTLRTLDVRHNKITIDGGQAFIVALGANYTLTNLGLLGNDTSKVERHIDKLLSENHILAELRNLPPGQLAKDYPFILELFLSAGELPNELILLISTAAAALEQVSRQIFWAKSYYPAIIDVF